MFAFGDRDLKHRLSKTNSHLTQAAPDLSSKRDEESKNIVGIEDLFRKMEFQA